MKIDENFREEHTLSDGTRVYLRLLQPEDAETLRRGFAELSPLSRYRRFLSGMPVLSDAMVDYLVHPDGIDHVAILATTDSHDFKTEDGLGIARFIRLKNEPTVAEAAVTVIDRAQNRGLGRLLLQTLSEAAKERGIHVIRGEILASNAPMRQILAEAGALIREDDGTTVVADVPLDWPPANAGEEAPTPPLSERHDHPLRRLLRAVAESLAELAHLGREG